MHEPTITVVGNVGRPPKQRTLAGGTVVADFRVASTPRRFDKIAQSWSDGETIWFGVTCWRALAEHASVSLKKGDRVIVTGRLLAKSWHAPDGAERTGFEIDATSVGLDLARGPAVQQRVERTSTSEDDDGWTAREAPDPTTGESVASQVASQVPSPVAESVTGPASGPVSEAVAA